MAAPQEARSETPPPRFLPPLAPARPPRAAFVLGALGLAIALAMVFLLVFH
jgi:hypothetical protein